MTMVNTVSSTDGIYEFWDDKAQKYRAPTIWDYDILKSRKVFFERNVTPRCSEEGYTRDKPWPASPLFNLREYQDANDPIMVCLEWYFTENNVAKKIFDMAFGDKAFVLRNLRNRWE